MPTPDNTDSDLEVSPQERTVSNSPNSEVQHGKYITNIGHVENLHHIGDKIDHKHANPVLLSPEEQKEAVLQFLQTMEESFKCFHEVERDRSPSPEFIFTEFWQTINTRLLLIFTKIY